MSEMNEHTYKEVSDSIKLVFDLTSRIDERVKMLVEQHNDTTQKIEKLMDRQENLLTRTSVLENKSAPDTKQDLQELRHVCEELKIKVAALEIYTARHESKWQMIGDFIYKTVLTVVGLFIAYKIGLK